MTVSAYLRGHEITWDVGWRWVDTGEPVGLGMRPCARCGQMPAEEGHDACVGTLPGVKAACCGHGVSTPYVLFEDGSGLSGAEALEWIQERTRP